MKNYAYFFSLLLLTISCKSDNQFKLQGNSDSKLDSIYTNLDSSSFRLLLSKSEFFDKYFSTTAVKKIKSEMIDDNIAKLMVKRDLRWASPGFNKDKERSVFFTLPEIFAILGTVNVQKSDNYGLRIYFAEYNSQDIEVVEYLNKKYNCGQCKEYVGKRTVILQFMDNKNDKYIYYGFTGDDLLNFNLGELCPPCSQSNSPTGGLNDLYIK